LLGQLIEHGGTLLTVTVKEQLSTVLDPSDALQVTVVVPTEKVVPDAGLHVTVTPEQLFWVGDE
jgi:hypothetical protein